MALNIKMALLSADPETQEETVQGSVRIHLSDEVGPEEQENVVIGVAMTLLGTVNPREAVLAIDRFLEQIHEGVCPLTREEVH